jgi:hypothetical protein
MSEVATADFERGVPDPTVEPTVSVERAGSFFGLGRSSAYQAVKNGDLPAIRIGARWVVPTAALRRMLALDDESPG